MKTLRVLLPALVVGLASCQVAYYAAMEQFGIEKRDLLKKAVAAVRQDQKEAGKEFQDALTQLKALYGFNGGNLEAGYNKFKAEYEDCDAQAKQVSSRIKEMNRVARDLFREWEKEIAEISTPALAADSRMKLSATRQRFEVLSANLHSSEASMAPVLRQFRDQVLYLKHNLNAAAIGSLRTTADGIQADIQSLLGRLDQSVREADAFIGSLR
ncbi:MAG: DUF2959 domain-containing protein [Verrucomicrobiaceae bacterium]|nr:DUF2959 domain-containing protein [Verrucomicrobiaceae bacterium]